MIPFRYKNPTEIVFGVGQIETLGELVSPSARVLLFYGGGSIKANGVYDRVKAALPDHRMTEFGGVEANPEYETILAAAGVARQAGCDFILAVGGGSVVDAAKFLATIIPMGEGDPWDRLVDGHKPTGSVPVGAVLTLPATGSESNPVSVISRRSRGLKLPFSYEGARPVFAVLDPSTMKSLSRRQLENGAVDAVVHVLEQYLTYPANAPIQIGYSEVLLEVLFEAGPRLVEEGTDEARETVMWAANQALNGLIGAGVPQDWATHMIGHAITARYGVDHARTLTMVLPSLLRYKRDQKLAMLARFARRVWKVDIADERKAADEGIARTEAFFRRMGCPVLLSEGGVIDPSAILEHLDHARQFPLGERQDIGRPDVEAILGMAA